MTNRQFTDPAAFLTARGYQVQTLAPAPAGPLAQLGRWIAANPSKVWPAVASAGVFALARWFHADGGTDPPSTSPCWPAWPSPPVPPGASRPPASTATAS